MKLLVFQLIYQEMRQTYNAQKKPLDKMQEKVKQLLEVLEEPIESSKHSIGKRAKKASQEPNTSPKERQKTVN